PLGEPAEETALPDAHQPLVERAQTPERFVECDEDVRALVGRRLRPAPYSVFKTLNSGVDRNQLVDTQSLGTALTPCVIDQHAAHDRRRHREEMCAVVPINAPLLDEPEIRLVDERGGAQRVALALAMELPVGDRPELGVHERDESIPRGPIVAA